jgi:putative nucleotidyltransferase with HDIG domain
MLKNNQISLFRLILSLSDSLDYFCPDLVDHQQRVTFMSVRIARKMGFSDADLVDVFLAASLHDIGIIRTDPALRVRVDSDSVDKKKYFEASYELLRNTELFSRASQIIRNLHRCWDHGREADYQDDFLMTTSQIIVLADFAERLIDRDRNILEQSGEIINQVMRRGGTDFNPRCVAAFNAIAGTDAFWLDTVSKRIYSLLHSLLVQATDEPLVSQTCRNIGDIAEVFASVVDSMSPWTASHTAGVAATAVALGKYMQLSDRERSYLRTAGLLHDLGKLSVPQEILNKREKLTPEDWIAIKGHPYHTHRILETIGFDPQIIEWAAFHHERIDGNGYPFRIKGQDLSLGSRIMAVADTYTALTEDRPYRKGMDCARAVDTLNKLVKDGGLDSFVVSILTGNLEAIDHIREVEQEKFIERLKPADGAIEQPEKQQA